MKNILTVMALLLVSLWVNASPNTNTPNFVIQMEFCDEGVCKVISRQANGLANNTETLLNFELGELSQQQIIRLGMDDSCEENNKCFLAAILNTRLRIEDNALTRFTAITELKKMEMIRVKIGNSEIGMLKNPNTLYQSFRFFDEYDWREIASGEGFRYRLKVSAGAGQ